MRSLNFKAYLPYLGLCFLLLMSCETDFEPDTLSDETTKSQHITTQSFENEIFLVFQSPEAFDEINNKVGDKSYKDFKLWEAQFDGFVSQRTLFENALLEIENYRRPYKKGMKLPESAFPQSVLTQSTLFYFEGINIDYKVRYKQGIENFINKNGLVKIGEQLFKFMHNEFYIIEDGDFSKLHLLDQYPEGSQELKISYAKINETKIDLASNETLRLEGNSCSGQNGNDRVVGDASVITTTISNYQFFGKQVKHEFSLRARSYKNGAFGWSLSPANHLRIDYDNFELRAGDWRNIVSGRKVMNNTHTVSLNWSSPVMFQLVGLEGLTTNMTGRLTFYGDRGAKCSFEDTPMRVVQRYTPDSATEGEVCVTWQAPSLGADFYKVYSESVIGSRNYDIVRTVYGTSFCKDSRLPYATIINHRVSAVKNGVESNLIYAIKL